MKNFFLFCFALMYTFFGTNAFYQTRGITISSNSKKNAELSMNAANIVVQQGHSGIINSTSFSPDGNYLVSGGGDKLVKLWDFKSAKEIKTLPLSVRCNSVDFSPDGKTVVIGSGSDDQLVIWNIYTDETQHFQVGDFDIIEIAKFTPDGKYVVCGGYNKTIYVWDIQKAQVIKTFTGHTEGIDSLDFKDNLLLSGASKAEIILWNFNTGKILKKITDNGRIEKVVLSPDCKYAFWVDAGSSVNVYDVKKQKSISSIKGYYYDAVITPNGKYLLAAGSDSAVYSIPDMKKVSDMPHEYDGLSISKNGKFIAAGKGGQIKNIVFWEIESNTMIAETSGRSNVNTIATAFDDNQVLFGVGSSVIAVNTYSGETEYSVEMENGVGKLAYDSQKKHCAAAVAYHETVVLDTKGNLLNSFEGKEHGSASVAFSFDSKYLAIGDYEMGYYPGEGIRIFDTASSALVYKLDFPNKTIDDLCFSVDNRKLFFISEDKLYLWNLTSKKEQNILENMKSRFNCLSVSPDKSIIAVGSYDGIVLLNSSTGQIIKSFNNDNISIAYSIVMNKDNSLIAVGDMYNSVFLFDAKTGYCVKQFNGHGGSVKAVIFSKNEKQIISGSSDGTVKYWDIESEKCLVTAIYEGNGEYLMWTPDGYFTGSDWAIRNLISIVKGMDIYSIEQFSEKLYRPDIIASLINGENPFIERNVITLDSVFEEGKAPDVRLNVPERKSQTRDVELGIELRDNGGGIGKIIVQLNGRNIQIGDSIQTGTGETIMLNHIVTLQNGDNTIKVSAFNRSNTIESPKAYAKLQWQGQMQQPRLYILAVAANKYRAQGMQLKYSVADADGIITAFSQNAGNLYSEVKITKLYDSQVTKQILQDTFTTLSKEIRADDVFVFYIAGHGITSEEDGDYYYLPVNFRYTGEDAITEQGVSKTTLTKLLSLITAEKTLVLLDTCSSGAFVKGSRGGLSEAAAMQRLSKATGHATLAASSEAQVAMEGYQGHGIFTFTMMDALNGKADSNGDGIITLQEMSNYVEYEVPERSFEKWGYEQVPQKILLNQDFPIAIGSK